MTKYMGWLYAKKTTSELKTMRSKKYNRLTKLQSQPNTYFNLRECEDLRQMILWIDAELEARALQQQLPL